MSNDPADYMPFYKKLDKILSKYDFFAGDYNPTFGNLYVGCGCSLIIYAILFLCIWLVSC